MPEAKVQLEKTAFYPGQRVAGVVSLALSRRTDLRGLRIRLVGTEWVRVQYGRQTRWMATATVDSELVLVGRERLPDIGAVIVDTWDTLLQRARHSVLEEGEYVYPFSIPLSTHVPPSYQGKTARVDYRLELITDRPLRRAYVKSLPIRVLPPGRNGTAFPLSLSSPGVEAAPSGAHARSPQVLFSVTLERQEFAAGGYIVGDYTVDNPVGELLEGLVVSLTAREETSAHGGSGNEHWEVARGRVPFKDMTALSQRGVFHLDIPGNATPSVAGRSFAVTYSLDIRLAAPRSSDLTLHAQVGMTAPPLEV